MLPWLANHKLAALLTNNEPSIPPDSKRAQAQPHRRGQQRARPDEREVGADTGAACRARVRHHAHPALPILLPPAPVLFSGGQSAGRAFGAIGVACHGPGGPWARHDTRM